jgi:LEA14-like dessication related protein
VSGTVQVETPLGVLDVPLSHAGRLPVPRLPEVRLTGARLGASSLTELTLDLSLRLANPNRFPLAGGRLTFDVLVAGVVVAEGREVTVGAIGPHGEAPVTLPLRLSLRAAGKVAGSLHGGTEVRLRGSASVAGVTTPFETAFRLGGE